MEKHRKFSIRMKMYIFVIIIVLAVAIGTSAITFLTSANQIDGYYKQNTADNARNFASMVDGDYLKKLRIAAESEEFQKLREQAEEAEDEKMIETYLREHDLWEEYSRIRDMITSYLANMEGIKYLYVVAHGGPDADYDMYLVDDKENPLYETGYYEEREAELRGLDISMLKEPTISNGDWGWLCSAYAPVYDSNGETVCQIGCDFGMDDVMAERHRSMMYIIFTAIALTVLVLIGAVIFINRIVIKPINSLTAEMKKFKPQKNTSYDDADVINLDIHSNDEIEDLYNGIHTMQIDIIDYLNDLDMLQKDKERAEEDIKAGDEKIGEISKEAYRDSLTGVGSKAAYIKKVSELNKQMEAGHTDLGIVMVDMNELKRINDQYGHRMGDSYIIGCCRYICDTFKHSPVYRIGGDEFVVILQGVDFNNRLELVEKLKKLYESAMNNNRAKPWERYSAAVGMAEMASDDRTVDLVFKRADKAMYMDKQRIKEGHVSYR